MAEDFFASLNQHDDAAWARVYAELAPAIHAVDQRATRIWLAFFPVKLQRALRDSPHPKMTVSSLLLKGSYQLTEQVDTSARFLYGHRYWPAVKAAVAEHSRSATSAPLAEQIRQVARRVAASVQADESLLMGITLIAFATLQQVGLEAFNRAAQVETSYDQRSPEQIIADRAQDDSQGLFGFLKTVDKKFSVVFNERDRAARFPVLNGQDVATAAAEDKRDHHNRDARCRPGEGPIPVECRTAACGTCWVGVLSPTEKLNPPTRRELEKWVYFGYEGFTGQPDSPIRLACQLKASGNVTIVIPPWCGMIGKLDEKAQAQAS